MKSKTLKILISLVTINTITLFIYFSLSPHHQNHNQTPPQQPHHHVKTKTSKSKPWPILPSYLPWSHQSPPPPSSCESLFGNGFSSPFHLINSSSSSSPSSWFRCFFSKALESSVCEGGNVRMNPDRIRMSEGGERLESVIGREEDVELPEFEFGAFDVIRIGGPFRGRKTGKIEERLVKMEVLNEFMWTGEISRHTMRNLVGSMRVVSPNDFQCDEWVEEPTLLVTRFEYANLFHTITDWYSAYVASRVTGLPNRPHVVFVDGHCLTPLEETWKAMFSSLRYAKNFSGPVCFRHAILSPLGYETVLFKGLVGNIDCYGASAHDLWQQPDDRKTARISEFGEMIRASFGFPLDRHISKPVSVHNVLFVRREDYLAHPRHGGKVQSRLSNEEEIFDSIKMWVSTHRECKINLVNGIFAHIPMREQVRAIQDASVIIGAHGAGLTHIVSATPGTVVLEIISPDFMRPHFALISKWKGLEYHSIHADALSYAKPTVVVDKLRGILRSLGC